MARGGRSSACFPLSLSEYYMCVNKLEFNLLPVRPWVTLYSGAQDTIGRAYNEVSLLATTTMVAPVDSFILFPDSSPGLPPWDKLQVSTHVPTWWYRHACTCWWWSLPRLPGYALTTSLDTGTWPLAISRHPMLDHSCWPRYVGLVIPAHIRQPSYIGIPFGMSAQSYPAMLARPYLCMPASPILVNLRLGQPFIMSLGHVLTLPGVIPPTVTKTSSSYMMCFTLVLYILLI
jgi:hypothetical protein